MSKAGHQVEDCGANGSESVDYPDYAVAVARRVADGDAERGILVCGTGIGISIAANKVRGVRAAVAFDEQAAEMSRRHNDANVLALGARIIGGEVARDCLHAFLSTAFDGGERHLRRVVKLG